MTRDTEIRVIAQLSFQGSDSASHNLEKSLGRHKSYRDLGWGRAECWGFILCILYPNLNL